MDLLTWLAHRVRHLPGGEVLFFIGMAYLIIVLTVFGL